ncbi:hypothetical protein TRFO_42368 [Tritrichomonas foetus]|uniref:Death ligand signal enhancer n=1 Tax=Tritrichomonas foetus TaxID=1144522 RepID=A0A1J4KWP8_9EUKA|nr:hypothetical protein TRFO_42368 [Tritrichomonas foetus]|eukprot:OHT15675.1 hypothetical protein TRFO_42368 [Tritrichomonas foetus]
MLTSLTHNHNFGVRNLLSVNNISAGLVGETSPVVEADPYEDLELSHSDFSGFGCRKTPYLKIDRLGYFQRREDKKKFAASVRCRYALQYFEGDERLKKDDGMAAKYFKLAADDGNAQAQFSLGVLLYSGIPEGDSVQSFSSFSMPQINNENIEINQNNSSDLSENLQNLQSLNSDNQSDTNSEQNDNKSDTSNENNQLLPQQQIALQQLQLRLQQLQQQPQPLKRDLKEAVKYLRAASLNGHSKAQYCYGLCLANGEGVRQNTSKAVRLFRLSARGGYDEAQYCYGRCLFNGFGVPKRDYKTACEYFKMAAGQGHARAAFYLGLCLHQGLGVERDRDEGISYVKFAAEKGLSEAKMILESMKNIRMSCNDCEHHHQTAAAPSSSMDETDQIAPQNHTSNSNNEKIVSSVDEKYVNDENNSNDGEAYFDETDSFDGYESSEKSQEVSQANRTEEKERKPDEITQPFTVPTKIKFTEVDNEPHKILSFDTKKNVTLDSELMASVLK